MKSEIEQQSLRVIFLKTKEPMTYFKMQENNYTCFFTWRQNFIIDWILKAYKFMYPSINFSLVLTNWYQFHWSPNNILKLHLDLEYVLQTHQIYLPYYPLRSGIKTSFINDSLLYARLIVICYFARKKTHGKWMIISHSCVELYTHTHAHTA